MGMTATEMAWRLDFHLDWQAYGVADLSDESSYILSRWMLWFYITLLSEAGYKREPSRLKHLLSFMISDFFLPFIG